MRPLVHTRELDPTIDRLLDKSTQRYGSDSDSGDLIDRSQYSQSVQFNKWTRRRDEITVSIQLIYKYLS